MNTEEQQITTQYGKIIRKFKILHFGWDMDGFGYIVENAKGSQPKHILILTNHSKPYVADLSELRSKIHEYQYAIGETNSIIDFFN
jgi:hypothetical protein